MVLSTFSVRECGGWWEDELKNKTNLSQRLVEVEAELGNDFTIIKIITREDHLEPNLSSSLCEPTRILYRTCNEKNSKMSKNSK